jgi:hypothetical protein
MIGGLVWSENRDAGSLDAWHNGRHCRMMNSNNNGWGIQLVPQSIKMARRATNLLIM